MGIAPSEEEKENIISKTSTFRGSSYKPTDEKKNAHESSSSFQISSYSLIRYRILSPKPFPIERVDNPITQS